MVDLHTHILPGWDDGAADQAEADRMADVARRDGITKIVATPHAFRMTEHDDTVRGLDTRLQSFVLRMRTPELVFYSGAEVYVHHDMIPHIKDFGLTVNGSNFVFIEFPSGHVPGGAADLVYRMMLDGLIPIVSHPERNSELARSPEILYELVRRGAVAQVTAQSITGQFGPEVRKAAEVFLENNLVHVIASDAHNSEARPPRLAEAVEVAGKIVGPVKAKAMVTSVPEAILANEQIPDFDEPHCPEKKSRRLFHFR